MAGRPKFFKVMRVEHCLGNEMSLPHVFCLRFARSIPLTVKLVIRNGYEMWVDFDKKNERFIGMSFLYSHFGMVGGEVLLFDYVGGFNFNVCMLGVDWSEIEYPSIVHHFQTSLPKNVSLYDGGWSFAHCVVSKGRKVVNEVAVPQSFIDRVGHLIPHKVDLVVTSGVRVNGFFDVHRCKLSGIASVANMLGNPSLSCLSVLVFNYVMNNTIVVSAFDAAKIETDIDIQPSQRGSDTYGNSIAFEILVQRFHLYRYSYGVDVSVDFRVVHNWWDKTDYINVYKDNRCWVLEIRKRRDLKRICIHDGWDSFRADFELELGDVCIFHWKNDTIRNFDVEVQKAIVHIP